MTETARVLLTFAPSLVCFLVAGVAAWVGQEKVCDFFMISGLALAVLIGV